MSIRTTAAAAAVLLAAVAGCVAADAPKPLADSAKPGADARPAADRTDPPLVSGRWMSATRPTTAASIGSFPANVVVSPDGKYAITTGQGTRNHLTAVRLSDGQVTGKVDFRSSAEDKGNGLYYGLVFGPDGKLYAAQGAAGRIAVVTLGADGSLDKGDPIETGKGSFPAGLAIEKAARL
ncbi:MAG TPA: hypothetical protein VF796_19585 [Humisphaera sp.]